MIISDLEEALARYKQAAGKSALIDLDRIWTWDDILDEVDKSQRLYAEASQGMKGVIRRGFRKVGDLEPAINPWVDLIPSSNNYLSLLCGGLRLVLAVCKPQPNAHVLISTTELCCIIGCTHRGQETKANLRNLWKGSGNNRNGESEANDFSR